MRENKNPITALEKISGKRWRGKKGENKFHNRARGLKLGSMFLSKNCENYFEFLSYNIISCLYSSIYSSIEGWTLNLESGILNIEYWWNFLDRFLGSNTVNERSQFTDITICFWPAPHLSCPFWNEYSKGHQVKKSPKSVHAQSWQNSFLFFYWVLQKVSSHALVWPLGNLQTAKKIQSAGFGWWLWVDVEIKC